MARGGGTSQAGQTVGSSLVVDCSKYLNRILDLDIKGARCTVEPGIVLDELNRQLKPHGLWFPVDISTASRATIGGMAGNNSCGGRSLRYGTMRDNVLSIEAVLADGTLAHFGRIGGNADDVPAPLRPLAKDLLAIGAREADEVAARFPKVQRRVGGYNLDALVPGKNDINLAHLLVGSEGTLGFSTRVELKLSPLLGRRAVGACHFGSFHEAMDAAQHIVQAAADRGRAGRPHHDRARARHRDVPADARQPSCAATPEAMLLVEFAEDDHEENLRRLRRSSELMGDLGFGWDKSGDQWGGVVEVLDPELQAAITEVRTSGLNIMMSMKERGQTGLLRRGLRGAARASRRLHQPAHRHLREARHARHLVRACVGSAACMCGRCSICGRKKTCMPMRAIAEEAFAMVREYKGSHSGEHGDGLVRSEFHEPMFGSRLVARLRGGEGPLRPAGPVQSRQDRARRRNSTTASLFRLRARLSRRGDRRPQLDWSAYPGAGGGFQGAVEMCNNNGACRKLAGGVMCPSYRATRDERDVTRGRANTLRLAHHRPARARTRSPPTRWRRR